LNTITPPLICFQSIRLWAPAARILTLVQIGVKLAAAAVLARPA
jgi:hypothetical protein